MFCSRCGKKVLESMLFCPFCGSEIIIPEQDDVGESAQALEPVAEPEIVEVPVERFTFDVPGNDNEEEPDSEAAPDAEEQPEPDDAEEIDAEAGESAPEQESAPAFVRVDEPRVPEMRKREKVESLFGDDLEDSDEDIDDDDVDEEEPRRKPERRDARDDAQRRKKARTDRDDDREDRRPQKRRSDKTYVPEKSMDDGDMFMDDIDDGYDEFDDYGDDDYDRRRGSRKSRRDEDFDDEDYGRSHGRKSRRDDDYEDNEDDDEEDDSFFMRHIRGIVGILLFVVLIAVIVVYLLSDSGQASLARINTTLPLRAEVYSKAGYASYQSEEYHQAGVYYERALEREPGSYNYASSAAMCYIKAGETENAAAMLKKCIEIKPMQVEPYVYLLNLYPDAAERPWEVTQLVRQGYEYTGDERLKGV